MEERRDRGEEGIGGGGEVNTLLTPDRNTSFSHYIPINTVTITYPFKELLYRYVIVTISILYPPRQVQCE